MATTETKRRYDRARYQRLKAERAAAQPPDPIDLLDETVVAYLAGLTDADGSIYVTHTNRLRAYYPTIAWAMTHKPTIERVAALLGVKSISLHNVTNMRRGRSSWGPSKFKDQWMVRINGARARRLCERMLPYMITKLEQARLVSVFPCDARSAPGIRLSDAVRASRMSLGEQISALNHR